MDGAKRDRSLGDSRCVFARMWVCVCYLISPESTAHPVDAVQWERVEWTVVCECVYICVGEVSGETYRELQAAITLATVYKYFHIYNRFFQWLQRGSGLSSVWTSAPSTLGDQASCITITLPTNPPVHQRSSFGGPLILRLGLIHLSWVSVMIDRFTC